MTVTSHHWHPWRPAVEFAERLADGKQTLEIGPGTRPFSAATEYAGWPDKRVTYDKPFHAIDLDRDSLPYIAASLPFVYCRHTVEDLNDPEWCLSEIWRVAKAGYIETPSPIAELCRGVDAELMGPGRPKWRGYYHHRSFVWDSDGVLMVLPKFPFIEHCKFGEMDDALADMLNSGPLFWNTYFPWEGPLRYQVVRHELDFEIGENYGKWLDRAVRESAESCRRFQERVK